MCKAGDWKVDSLGTDCCHDRDVFELIGADESISWYSVEVVVLRRRRNRITMFGQCPRAHFGNGCMGPNTDRYKAIVNGLVDWDLL